jgi:hypothetical protein
MIFVFDHEHRLCDLLVHFSLQGSERIPTHVLLASLLAAQNLNAAKVLPLRFSALFGLCGNALPLSVQIALRQHGAIPLHDFLRDITPRTPRPVEATTRVAGQGWRVLAARRRLMGGRMIRHLAQRLQRQTLLGGDRSSDSIRHA